MMKKSFLCFRHMIYLIRNDLILIILCIAPILAGILIRFVIPRVEILLCEYFNQSQIMYSYYYVFDWLIAMLPGTMFAFTGALTALGEMDDRTAGYMAITPVGKSGYVIARLIYPSLISGVASFIVLKCFELTEITLGTSIILAVTSALLGSLSALLILAVSTNKVEGMAIGKLSGLILLGLFVPIILKSPIQYVFCILPSFWLGKYLLSQKLIFLIGFFVIYVIWIWKLYRKFSRKIII